MSKRTSSGLAAYLRRFFTSWVAEDPDPQYSALDLADGIDRSPDPLTEPRVEYSPSAEVRNQARADSARTDPLRDDDSIGSDTLRQQIGSSELREELPQPRQ